VSQPRIELSSSRIITLFSARMREEICTNCRLETLKKLFEDVYRCENNIKMGLKGIG
jgi:hypothetical protein